METANPFIPPIVVDKGLITRAVSHLVDNAIKYSPEKTSVSVSTLLEREHLRVVVEDRGFGIPKDELDKIWQNFYRSERNGKQLESTGLGLPLVKEIVNSAAAPWKRIRGRARLEIQLCIAATMMERRIYSARTLRVRTHLLTQALPTY